MCYVLRYVVYACLCVVFFRVLYRNLKHSGTVSQCHSSTNDGNGQRQTLGRKPRFSLAGIRGRGCVSAVRWWVSGLRLAGFARADKNKRAPITRKGRAARQCSGPVRRAWCYLSVSVNSAAASARSAAVSFSAAHCGDGMLFGRCQSNNAAGPGRYIFPGSRNSGGTVHFGCP